MKKKGFTLAEVLIAMTIVGVVAAIIIPQFVTNTHNQAHASKLSTVVSDLQNALGTMMLNENIGDIFETSFGKAYTSSTTNTDDIGNALGRYMKVSQAATSTSDLGYIAFNFSSPLLPAAYAAVIDPCCANENSGCYNEYTCDSINYCIEHGGHHIPGADSNSIGGCVSCDPEHWDETTNTCNTTTGECGDQANAYSCNNPECTEIYNSHDCIKWRCMSDNANYHYSETTGSCIPRVPSSSDSSENPPSSNSSVMHTIRNESVGDNYFNFVFGVKAANNANIFFKAPETIDGTGYKVARVFVDVNGSKVPNKFGRDVFAYVLNEEGQLLPFGSESAALALGLSGNDNNTWKGHDETFGCTGNWYNGLGCTARLIENNYKVDY